MGLVESVVEGESDLEVVVCYYTLQRHCVEVSAARTTTDSWPQSASQSVS